METKTTITNLTHDDLVLLFSTATYGSDDFTICISRSTRDLLNIDITDSREDVWAKAVLAGYPIYVRDHRAEGCTYGDKGTLDQKYDGVAIYTITKDDIIEGLQDAMDGAFEPVDEDELESAARCAFHLRDESSEFDADEADWLMQIICFGAIIY